MENKNTNSNAKLALNMMKMEILLNKVKLIAK